MGSIKHASLFSWLAAFLAIAFLIESYSASRLKSPTFDEPVHIVAGLSYVQTGLVRLNLQHPPLLKELAGLFLVLSGVRWPSGQDASRMLAGTGESERAFGNTLIAENNTDRVLFWSRLPFILLSTLTGVVIYMFGREIVGDLAALGALFLYALDPTIVAHSFLVTTDVGLAGFMILFLWALWKYLRNPGPRWLLLAGLAMGLMLCTKFSAIFVVPVAGLLILAASWWPAERRDESRRSIFNPYDPNKRRWNQKLIPCACSFALMCFLALLVIDTIYLSPRGVDLYKMGMQLVNADHDPAVLAYMAGDLEHRFRSYLAVCYLVKEPLASIVFVAVGLYELKRTKDLSPLKKLFLLFPPAALFTAYTLWSDNVGIRYLIPVLPFVYLIGGLGLKTLVRSGAVFGRSVTVILALWMLIATTSIYPDHLSYFNEAACIVKGKTSEIGFDGGTMCGPLWLDDSNVDWGQGLKQLRTWLDQNAQGRLVHVRYFGSFPTKIYGIESDETDMPELRTGPQSGLYILSAHLVALLPAIGTKDHTGDGAWLRNTPPSVIVGHSLYIYDFSDKPARGSPPAPVPQRAHGNLLQVSAGTHS